MAVHDKPAAIALMNDILPSACQGHRSGIDGVVERAGLDLSRIFIQRSRGGCTASDESRNGPIERAVLFQGIP